MSKILSFIWEMAKIIIIALLIVVPIRYFVFQPFFVKGQSMDPNFENGDYLIIDELSYRFRVPERGEVVVFKYPNDLSQRYIKRIIGLPGETVEIQGGKITIISAKGKEVLDEKYLLSNTLTLGDTKMALGEKEYFVLGDNRAASSDSRRWGLLPEEDIVGRVILRAWPLTSFTAFGAPAY
ncbi:MAG: signal peptidase I [Candidatus Nealsonbacteria bacterium]|nr:signal peptidase I [Candidatus Nealsonbacteria bacterium]